MKTLVLIDGHSLAYRMHFALERTGMTNSKKAPTWAVYGFFNALFSLLKQVKPDAIALSFDMSDDTFRHEMFEAYKAHRESMPDALRAQMGLIREGVERLGIPIYQMSGFEADDVIGTLSRQAAESGMLVRILTGDQDAFQLVEDGKVEVLIPSRTPKEGLKTFNRQAVFEKLGVYPEQVVDFKGLKGDTSDNIPGVPGVGDKTAVKFLTEFKTLENLYENIDSLPANKMREKLEQYREQAILSKRLATIDRDVPIQVNLDDCKLTIPDMSALVEFLQECEFRTFINQASDLLAPFLQNGGRTTPLAVEMEVKPFSDDGQASQPVFAATATAVLDEASPEAVSEGFAGQVNLFNPADFQETQLKVEHILVTTSEQLAALASDIREAKSFSIDLETTGLDVLNDTLVGIALSFCPRLEPCERPAVNRLGLEDYPKNFKALKLNSDKSDAIQTYYIPLAHKDAHPQLEQTVVLDALKPLLEDASIVKIVHNAKFELNMFCQLGIAFEGLVFDTMLASYVQNPDRRHGLKSLGMEFFRYGMKEITALIGTGKKAIPFSEVPISDAAAYAACDAHVTLELALRFLQELTEDQWTLFYEIEMPLARVLAQMEREGVCLDTEYLKTLSYTLDEKLQAVEVEIFRLAGCQFNINSPKQVGEVLFEKLQIKPLKKTAGKTGFSTDAKVLEALAEEHAIVQKLLDYRQLFKLKSTYVDNLPGLIHPKTHRVHTSFNQTVTATGRLSSSNPNLQNIPIRSELGRLIRQAFIPQEKTGWFLISADYSQIELRLLAHFSEDPHLLESFRSGEDVHTATAALVFGVPKEEVTKEQRYRAKTVNFGVIYGQSAHGLSQQLKISRYEAQGFIDRYFEKYHRVKEYIESVKAEARRTGKVQTLCGRVRDLSEGLNSSVRSIREFSERAAFNTPLQGSAADLMKVAMIRLARKLERENVESKLILQVHDEMVLEVPRTELDSVTEWTKWAMQLGQPLRVPLDVDVHVGESWMEA